MKKKLLTVTFVSLAATCLCAGFSACGKSNNGSTPQQNAEIHEIYNSYVVNAEENGEMPLSYEEWLASIKGEKGDKGNKGDKGDKGDNGKSAYEIWLEQGHAGTEQDFLEWLKTDSENAQQLDFYPLDDGTYAVSAGKASLLSKIEIPATYKGKLVTKINENGFANCHNLTSIIIPKNVTSIGFGAFENCSKLTYNTKDNLKYLGNSENLYLYLADNTNSNITKATIDNNCRIIGYGAFAGCSNLTNIIIPNNVTSIGKRAFIVCSSLTSIMIPNSVTSIGEGAFNGCSGLTSVTIGNGVTSIGDYAFSGCRRLTSITIPDGVTSIGSAAFYECGSLTSIMIPNSVTSIGSAAFYECSSLTSIMIPNSVTSIGEQVFSCCSSLTNITIPDSVTSIENSAFSYCDNLTSVYYKGDKNKWDKITIYSYNEDLTNATRYYYSETKPATSGNFWHYNSKNEIEEW